MNREFLKQWRESGHDHLAAQLAPETMNDADRTVDVVWFTGVDIPRYNWWTDESYLLRMDPKGADLSYLNNDAPVCDNHILIRTKDQLGKVAKAWTSGKNYLATLQFSKHADLDRLWDDIRSKIVTKFSMGVELLETIEKRNKDNKLEVRTATNWRPFEISVAPIPADFGTTTLSVERPDLQARAAVLAHAHRARQIDILRLR